MLRRWAAVACLPGLLACGSAPESEGADVALPEGLWRGVLLSPGGELPFGMKIAREGETWSGQVINGEERAPFSSVEVDGREVVLAFDWYDSAIAAQLSEDGESMSGRWTKTAGGGGLSTLPFRATRDAAPRFGPAEPGEETILDSVDGTWAVEFTDEDGTEPARGELTQRDSEVLGTFLTPTGDYRFLAGSYEKGLLRLSTFDGAHAFLFHARGRPDGTLAGHFWSRDTYHATWTARRIEEEATILPDAWSLTGLTNDAGELSFTFPDLQGNPVSLDDPRFRGKVVLVNVFGSWCPNCNDKAPLLADWYRRYRDEGLEIVGLAYEYTGDLERDRRFVERFRDRHGVEYTLLLAGTSDKAAAAATLPDLTSVIAFPTTIFVDHRGKVRAIHTGFAGPGTGSHYGSLVAELESRIEKLLHERNA